LVASLLPLVARAVGDVAAAGVSVGASLVVTDWLVALGVFSAGVDWATGVLGALVGALVGALGVDGSLFPWVAVAFGVLVALGCPVGRGVLVATASGVAVAGGATLVGNGNTASPLVIVGVWSAAAGVAVPSVGNVTGVNSSSSGPVPVTGVAVAPSAVAVDVSGSGVDVGA
jgi:hypothetical protein